MSIDDFVTLTEAITQLLNVVVWPALLLFVLVRFGPAFREFFSSLAEFSFKGGGFEATARRKQAEAQAALVAASVARSDAATTPESAAREAREAVAVVTQSVNARVIRQASGATVLWVDDKPDNNAFERRALEALGVSFVLARSTEEALERMAREKFDAVISDMSRPADPRAGFTLLDKLRASGDGTPYVIYAGKKGTEQREEALRRGAQACTNKAAEMFSAVLAVLNRGARSGLEAPGARG